MYFLVNASPNLLQLQTLQVHRSLNKEGTGYHFQGHKMLFLVNALQTCTSA